jgi:hypothetical protein
MRALVYVEFFLYLCAKFCKIIYSNEHIIQMA